MRLFLLVTFLITVTGSGVLGARLLLAGMRSRTAPELAYGASLVFVATNAVLRLVVFGVLGGGSEYQGLKIVAGTMGWATMAALSWGLLVIFRPGIAWARALVGAFWVVGSAGLGMIVAFPGGVTEVGAFYQIGDLTSGFVALWGMSESFLYYSKMRRRLALGLADPVTTQQFALWGGSFALAFLSAAFLVLATMAHGGPITGVPSAMAAVQLCLVGTTVLTWLAFYPPERLRESLRRKHAAQSPAD